MDLKELCTPVGNSNILFRPYVIRKGINDDRNIFLVGINPATAIPLKDNLEEYVQLLEDHDSFIKHYSTNRKSVNKTEISRTRQGINSFSKWLIKEKEHSIVETNVIAYPTSSVKDLKKKEIADQVQKGKDVFKTVLFHYKPRLLIVHGKKAFVEIVELLKRSDGFHLLAKNALSCSMKELENLPDLKVASFKYNDGKEATIVACRHFMYYGNNGESFEQFRQNLLKLI